MGYYLYTFQESIIFSTKCVFYAKNSCKNIEKIIHNMPVDFKVFEIISCNIRKKYAFKKKLISEIFLKLLANLNNKNTYYSVDCSLAICKLNYIQMEDSNSCT